MILSNSKRSLEFQSGFTLIELMIVLVIISILVAIALPAYQEYTARAQATEGFTATSGLKNDIVAFVAESGRLPKGSDLKDKGAAAQIAAEAKVLDGRYFDARKVTVKAGGIINVEFSAGVNKGKRMTLTPTVNRNGQITGWKCAPGKPKKKAIDKLRLPASCQS